jgi:hypothetical protein
MRAATAANAAGPPILSGACRARFGEIPTSRCSDAPMESIRDSVRRQDMRSSSQSSAPQPLQIRRMATAPHTDGTREASAVIRRTGACRARASGKSLHRDA